MLLKNRLKPVGAFLALALAMGACTSQGSDAKDDKSDTGTTSTTTAGLKISKVDYDDVCSEKNKGVGGTFNLRAYEEGGGFDPATQTYSYQIGQQIYGSLMHWNRNTNKFEPWYAESLTPNADNTAWTLKLKDASYSDGTPLSAEAVKKSVLRFQDPKLPNAYGATAGQIKDIQVVDDKTAVFNLKSAWGTFPWLLATAPGQIVNPKVLDRLSSAELAATPPPEAGLGAFTFVSHTTGRDMKLTAKKDWWNGPVCINNINVTWDASGQNNIEAMKAGQADYFYTFDAPAVKEASSEGNTLYQGPWLNSPYAFNFKDKTIADPDIRKAIQLSADGSITNKRIWGGFSSDSHAIAPPDSVAFPTVKPLGTDVAAAKKMADKAAAAGWDKKMGFVINATPQNLDQAILQQAMAKSAGITLDRDDLQISEYNERIYVQRNFQMTQGGTRMEDGCPWCSLAIFQSDNPGNWQSYSSKTFDDAMTTLRAARTPDEITEGMNGVQTVWNDEMPAAILGWLRTFAVVSPRVHGLINGTGTRDIYLERAYLSK